MATAPVRSVRNQFRGINPHLHSLWQAEGRWSGFHTLQIAQLLIALKTALRPMGYTADVEESLQIRRVGDPTLSPHADILISDSDFARVRAPRTLSATSLATIPLLNLLEEGELSEKPFRAITILNADAGQRTPIAWIELLSPSNIGDSDDAGLYRAKRLNLLAAGLVFVEIDYLHETPPTFHTLPDYMPIFADEHSDAYPYRITVIDPRPSVDEGTAQVVQFRVDEPIPTVDIPLVGADRLTFDFNAPYQHTFREIFYGDNVDYAALSVNLDRYRPDDQQRIVWRMLAVIAAAQAGQDLEAVNLVPVNLPLDEALAHLRRSDA